MTKEPFDGLEKYYHRLFQQIEKRREDEPPLGTGGDLDCLIAMVKWLWTRYEQAQAEALQSLAAKADSEDVRDWVLFHAQERKQP